MKYLNSNWFLVWLIVILILGVVAFLEKSAPILIALFVILVILVGAKAYINVKSRK